MLEVMEYDIQSNEQEAGEPSFGELYIDVRYKEKRVLTDCQVMFLPDIDPGHIHFNEWEMRKRSSQRLTDHLKEKGKPLNILEVGCGNGWLSAKMAAIKNTIVKGIDANELEIKQAKRVFTSTNLEFFYAGFDPDLFGDERFDVIVFAASVQYFSSLRDVMQNALSRLTKNGEIHLVDTHFYGRANAEQAAKRTAEYYESLGYPEMAAHYFHHTINDLKSFNYRVLFNPHRLINKFTRKDPFYWIAVKN
ncbi:MAG TPA: class I SAM-dependent methyltransferase [Mucilaginibacter sp.]